MKSITLPPVARANCAFSATVLLLLPAFIGCAGLIDAPQVPFTLMNVRMVAYDDALPVLEFTIETVPQTPLAGIDVWLVLSDGGEDNAVSGGTRVVELTVDVPAGAPALVRAGTTAPRYLVTVGLDGFLWRYPSLLIVEKLTITQARMADGSVWAPPLFAPLVIGRLEFDDSMVVITGSEA